MLQRVVENRGNAHIIRMESDRPFGLCFAQNTASWWIEFRESLDWKHWLYEDLWLIDRAWVAPITALDIFHAIFNGSTLHFDQPISLLRWSWVSILGLIDQLLLLSWWLGSFNRIVVCLGHQRRLLLDLARHVCNGSSSGLAGCECTDCRVCYQNKVVFWARSQGLPAIAWPRPVNCTGIWLFTDNSLRKVVQMLQNFRGSQALRSPDRWPLVYISPNLIYKNRALSLFAPKPRHTIVDIQYE